MMEVASRVRDATKSYRLFYFSFFLSFFSPSNGTARLAFNNENRGSPSVGNIIIKIFLHFWQHFYDLFGLKQSF